MTWVRISRERWAVDELGRRIVEQWERCAETGQIRVVSWPVELEGPVQVGTLA